MTSDQSRFFRISLFGLGLAVRTERPVERPTMHNGAAGTRARRSLGALRKQASRKMKKLSNSFDDRMKARDAYLTRSRSSSSLLLSHQLVQMQILEQGKAVKITKQQTNIETVDAAELEPFDEFGVQALLFIDVKKQKKRQEKKRPNKQKAEEEDLGEPLTDDESSGEAPKRRTSFKTHQHLYFL
jgi:hypothetical protein